MKIKIIGFHKQGEGHPEPLPAAPEVLKKELAQRAPAFLQKLLQKLKFSLKSNSNPNLKLLLNQNI